MNPQNWPAPRWLDSSVGRALHLYRRGHTTLFKPKLFFHCLVLILKLNTGELCTAMINRDVIHVDCVTYQSYRTNKSLVNVGY